MRDGLVTPRLFRRGGIEIHAITVFMSRGCHVLSFRFWIWHSPRIQWFLISVHTTCSLHIHFFRGRCWRKSSSIGRVWRLGLHLQGHAFPKNRDPPQYWLSRTRAGPDSRLGHVVHGRGPSAWRHETAAQGSQQHVVHSARRWRDFSRRRRHLGKAVVVLWNYDL